METGQQFLMQLSNKENTSNELSILILKDGFSFCTHEQQHFFGLRKETPSPDAISKAGSSTINSIPKSVPLIYMDHPAVTVPLSHCLTKKQPEAYLKTAYTPDEHTLCLI